MNSVNDGYDASHIAVSLPVSRQLPPPLPRTIKLQYMNEGAANILYRICYSKTALEGDATAAREPEEGHASLDTLWKGKLLRLRKKLPNAMPCHLNLENYETFIKPQFRSCDLVDQQLVEIQSSGIIPSLNQELKKWEATPNTMFVRPSQRQGTYLADDNYGLLVRDMSPGPEQELYEFKTKWLVQSLAAPDNSKRCRTCAKRARDTALLASSDAVNLALNTFCPLDLASKNDNALSRAGKSVLSLGSVNGPLTPVQSTKLAHFIAWAKTSPLLAKLKQLQVDLDQKGVFDSDPMDMNFLTAMSLRDCSVFLHINLNNVMTPVTARIGDLDLKSPVKVEYWRTTERSLIDEGWYSGTEREENKQPLDCSLFPEARGSFESTKG